MNCRLFINEQNFSTIVYLDRCLWFVKSLQCCLYIQSNALFPCFRKTVKALVILCPMLGINYGVSWYIPRNPEWLKHTINVIVCLIDGTQVIIYFDCFSFLSFALFSVWLRCFLLCSYFGIRVTVTFYCLAHIHRCLSLFMDNASDAKTKDAAPKTAEMKSSAPFRLFLGMIVRGIALYDC